MVTTSINLPNFNPSDEAEMREFFARCGFRERTTEAAIQLRKSKPVTGRKKPPALLGKPKPNAAQSLSYPSSRQQRG
jgi:hypothetical protein